MSDAIRMFGIHGLGLCIGIAILAAMQGCSTNPAGLNADSRSGADAEVRIQVCLPNKRVYFNDLELDRLENHPLFTQYSRQQLELAPKTIRRIAASRDPRAIHVYGIAFGEVLIRSGQFSDGSGFMPLQDATVSDQPVYERESAYPARHYVAMHVRLPDQEMGPEGGVTYWFTLPNAIPDDRFTIWFDPVSMEPDRATEGGRSPIWWRLTHGGDLPMYPLAADPPKMRVTLMKRRALHTDPAIDSLPALTTARMRYRTATSDQQFVYEFVPKTNEKIPACH